MLSYIPNIKHVFNYMTIMLKYVQTRANMTKKNAVKSRNFFFQFINIQYKF